jgi:hypothetical protein
MTGFWDVVPCSRVEINDVSEAVNTSKCRAISTRLHGVISKKTVTFLSVLIMETTGDNILIFP